MHFPAPGFVRGTGATRASSSKSSPQSALVGGGGGFSDRAGTHQETHIRTTAHFYWDTSTRRACRQVATARCVQGRCFGCVAAPVIGQTCGDLASRGAGAAVPQPLPSALMRSGTSVLGGYYLLKRNIK